MTEGEGGGGGGGGGRGGEGGEQCGIAGRCRKKIVGQLSKCIFRFMLNKYKLMVARLGPVILCIV